MPRDRELLELKARVDEAAEQLRAATKTVYPIGSMVDVVLGRSDVRGRVIGYGCDWVNEEADVVVIKNVITEKTREFKATFHDVDRVA